VAACRKRKPMGRTRGWQHCRRSGPTARRICRISDCPPRCGYGWIRSPRAHGFGGCSGNPVAQLAIAVTLWDCLARCGASRTTAVLGAKRVYGAGIAFPVMVAGRAATLARAAGGWQPIKCSAQKPRARVDRPPRQRQCSVEIP